MQIAPLPENENARLEALLRYRVLDTDAEEPYNDLVKLAASICQTPISLVSLVDRDRQWFKAKVGLEASETPRDIAFCAHAILKDEMLVVPDTLNDCRFADNPLVTGEPKIRFYAGTPLKTPEGLMLGTLCVIDQCPHVMTNEQREALAALGRQAIGQLELRRHVHDLRRMNDYKTRFLSMLSHDLRGAFNTVMGFAEVVVNRFDKLPKQDTLKYLNEIRVTADSAHRQLNNLLEWSKFELGKVHFDPRPYYADEFCHAALAFVKPLADRKAIAIEFDCENHCLVEVDRWMMTSIIQNLLMNSIKFSLAGSRIHFFAGLHDGDFIIRVADEGVGMSESQMQRLFTDTDLASCKGTEGECGAGIGSTLVKTFTDYHHGTIDIKSCPGQGTTVTITVPNYVMAHAAQRASQYNAAKPY